MTGNTKNQFSVALEAYRLAPRSQFRLHTPLRRVDAIFAPDSTPEHPVFNCGGPDTEDVCMAPAVTLDNWQQLVFVRLPNSESMLTSYAIFVYHMETFMLVSIDELEELVQQIRADNPSAHSLERVADLVTSSASRLELLQHA